ncbi:hypothetical protein C8F04DRAFT_1269741 [Mycena alexandri]|uniref:Reverse transcriptase zinc-binding domain-containing protein n=1 Tax=Mycena alexandri TaxID=1745969 RepID=A0AAD6WU63_9AGAR|nr:hypothetical protein C8F04DRAFT_1269741 [Mycena alexandri]
MAVILMVLHAGSCTNTVSGPRSQNSINGRLPENHCGPLTGPRHRSPRAHSVSKTLSRKPSSIIAQLRTDASPLNAYRHNIGAIGSPRCEACGAANETRAHYVLECPRWEPYRQPLHVACRKVGLFGSIHLSPILSNPKLLGPLAGFVEATKRFD